MFMMSKMRMLAANFQLAADVYDVKYEGRRPGWSRVDASCFGLPRLFVFCLRMYIYTICLSEERTSKATTRQSSSLVGAWIRRSGRSGHCVCSASTTSHNDWLLSPPPSSPFPNTKGWLALTPNATS